MKKKEQGSITLEATLILTLFIMGYMCIMSMIQVVQAQSVLQFVADQAALEISRSTYLLTKSGITGEIFETSKKGKKFEGDTAQVVNNVKTLYSSLGAVSNSTPSNFQQNVNKVVSDYHTATNGAKEYLDTYAGSGEEIWSTLTTWGTMKAEQFGTSLAVQELVKNRIKKQLVVVSGGKDPDEYLKKLGVKGGLNGLDFKGTEWMQDNTLHAPAIRIEMTYNMEFNWYYFVVKDLKYKATAYTAVW